MVDDTRTGHGIAATLRSEILSGALPEGARLPSIAQMQERFTVKKGVVEHAIRILRGEGLIVTRPGAPILVKRFRRVERHVDRLKREQWGKGPAPVDITVAQAPLPDFATHRLGLPPGTVGVIRSGSHMAHGRVIELSVSYMPVPAGRRTAVLLTDPGPGGIYARLDETGSGPTLFVEETIVRAATPDEAHALTLAAAARVYEIIRSAMHHERCVEVSRMILDTDAYKLVTVTRA